MTQSLIKLKKEIDSCNTCTESLPLNPKPIYQIASSANILIVGQAPGIRAHEAGVPFLDPSGDRLRQWLGCDKDTFYNPNKIAILPMGFCYPGTSKNGDLPPRPECERHWRDKCLGHLSNLEFTLLVGNYAMQYHLADTHKNVKDTVKSWEELMPSMLALPHPSPRNNRWLKQNPWFEQEVIPLLQKRVSKLLK